MECAPAFNYARAPHTMEVRNAFIQLNCHLMLSHQIVADNSVKEVQNKVVFKSETLSLDLRYIVDTCEGNKPVVEFQELDLTQKVKHIVIVSYCVC